MISFMTCFALALFSLTYITNAQDLSTLPTCGQTCISNELALAGSLGCSSTDITCLCKNTNFANGISSCLVQSCSNSDATAVANYLATLCAATGGVTSAAASVTSRTSTTSTVASSQSTTSKSITTVINGSTSIISAPTTSSTSSAGTSGTDTQRGHKGLSGGAIAGIVIGVLLGLALLGVLAWFLLRRRKRQPAPTVNPFETKKENDENLPEVVSGGGARTQSYHYPELEGDPNAATDFHGAANAPIPVASEKVTPARNASLNAPIAVEQSYDNVLPSPDSASDSLHGEYARVQQRKSRLQELMRLEEEEDRLRRQIGASSQTQIPPAELPSHHEH